MSDIPGVDLNGLDAAFGDTSKSTPNIVNGRIVITKENPKKIEGVDLGALDSAFGGMPEPIVTKEANVIQSGDGGASPAIASTASGLWQGIKDIPNSGAQAIGFIDRNLAKVLPTGGEERAQNFENRLKAERASLPVDDSSFDFGRGAGQALATAPLMPVKAFQAINTAAKTIPYVGRAIGSALSGAVGGSIYGAATNSTNDEGLVSNVGTNAAYGAAAGPVAELGLKAAGGAISGVKNIINDVRTANILKNSSIEPSAAKNVLARLTEAGYTPDQARVELQRLGPKATLSDLSPSLTTEAGGLASKGGLPTDTLKGRFTDRADAANTAAHDIMEQKLGVKPDYEIEKAAAKLERQKQTSADYNKAKASNMALDVMPVAQHIKDQLENAVGSEAKELHAIGSFLFDRNGNIKVDTKPLLKVRQAIDDHLSKLKSEGTSQASATYRAVSEVRDRLDKVLKTNSDLAMADAKYAKLRQDFEGLDLGKKSVTNTGNYSDFSREFNKASPEKQEFMRKGLRIQIGDQMEKATRGELSEAQRLFGKSTSNRKIIELAFGQNGTDTLNALEKEAKFRATEHSVKANSLTAERQAVHNRPEYGGGSHEGNFLTPVASGAALDLVTGTPGAATAIGAGKGAYQGIKDTLSKERIRKTLEGSADLLSRQAHHGRDTALDLLSQIKVRNNSKLPIDYSGVSGRAIPAAIPVIKRTKSRLSDIVGIR